MDRNKFIVNALVESAETKVNIQRECMNDINSAVDLLINMYKNGHKLLLCGNGGSAADCQHIATELMIRLNHKIQRPALPAIALTTDTSNMTACGNDIGFENVFARNVEGLGQAGDVLLAISTSGNSSNIVKAVNKAKEQGMKVIGFLGGTGGQLLNIVDIPIKIPSYNTQRIQEGHITVAHIICELLESELYP